MPILLSSCLSLHLCFSFSSFSFFFFFFNDTATTEIYTLSLHDALPIYWNIVSQSATADSTSGREFLGGDVDRKSTRLNSSHANISYAVFCLKKKKKNKKKNKQATQ